LISAANCSGKSFVLRRLGQHAEFKDWVTVEMDSLRYYVRAAVDEQLPRATRTFETWLRTQTPSALLSELVSNISTSTREEQLVKMTLVELARGQDRVITVNPEMLRYDLGHIRFYEVLEEYFGICIKHLLIHPTICRYLVNLFNRGRARLSDRGFRERARLYANNSQFDGVLKTRLFNLDRTHVAEFFRSQLL
jgi:hypothetical protein